MPQATDGFTQVINTELPELLARKHVENSVTEKPASVSSVIESIANTLEEALTSSHKLTHDNERVANWILDNDYQLERAVRQIKKDIPDPFYREQPGFLTDDKRIIPRVLDIAHTLLQNTRLQVTRSVIVQFINEYQQHTALQHGELWALPAMLRLSCLSTLTMSLVQLDPQLRTAQNHVRSGALPVDDPAECVARTIASLVVLNSIDWKAVVDELSDLEKILSTDPAGAYHQMGFATRERYRKAVESVARNSRHSEHEVAAKCVSLAMHEPGNSRQHHVGYWMIDDGLSVLEREMDVKHRRFRVARLIHEHARSLYAGLLIMATLIALWLPFRYLGSSGASLWHYGVSMLLMIIPSSVLAVTVVHWLVPMLTRPATLPSLDFKKAIPLEYGCAVSIPVILKDVADASDAIQKLEMQWLANPDPALRYVLLSDLADASCEHLASDDEIVSALISGIDQLNQKHATESRPFILLHRQREFNSSEGCWMGWERKRGKLANFNQLLLRDDLSAFAVVAGPTASLAGTRYVITLDADSLLPPGAAAELVGTLAHPLNRATLDDATGRVEQGYTVLQPRIELVQDAGDHSVFAKLYAGDSAIDIYSRAVSDVYQDLFDTGLYVGKGIYDVAAFEQCIENRMPENRILSHDLIEGVHGRVGLVSDIVLYEQFPDSYPEYAMRQHRWIRGDWQLLPWLAPVVPMAGGIKNVNPLSLLDRWKLVDNLRRSLVPPVLLLLLVFSWTVLPGNALVWTILTLAILGSFLINDAWIGIRQGVTLRLSTGVVYRLQQQFGRWFLSIVFLVNDALVAMDAIVRTLWRTLVSHRQFLEWRSAAHSSQLISSQSSHLLHWKSMWPGSVVSIAIGMALFEFEPQALWAATPVLLLWITAPEIAYRFGQAREFRRETLTGNDREFLIEVARRTWHYFDTFARPQDHWLPPDNFQEAPKGDIAHRTSPTNIGLYLVATLVGRDFGFIGSSELSVRCSNTLNTMANMEMYQGHLLNWYNTTTLEPLEPRYVSTVDNGNLAFSLLTIKHGCIDYAHKPIIDEHVIDGLDTGFRLLKNCVHPVVPPDDSSFHNAITVIETRINQLRVMGDAWYPKLQALIYFDWPLLQQFIGDLIDSESLTPQALHELHTWYERFNHQLLVMHRDIERFFPWLPLICGETIDQTDMTDGLRAELLFQPLHMLIRTCNACLSTLDVPRSGRAIDKNNDEQLISLQRSLSNALEELRQLQSDLELCASRADAMAYAMNFDMLYDTEANLFRIGYNVSTGRFDHNTYDLLASEARLASFFAIAKKDVPIEHWAHLGRPVSRVGRMPVLLSWSGSMFEYLMPALFLPGKRDTLLGESEKLAVIRQRNYATERGVPWGISESAFAALDVDDNYQYRAFGTPGLGLRRGLSQDLVIAPYASALALCVFPESAVENLRQLASLDAQGVYGFIDALDYTHNRRTASGAHHSVQTYMAHHQGMTLAAVANALRSDVLVERVLREKPLQTIELLLQERIAWDAPVVTGRKHELVAIPRSDHVFNELPSWVPRPNSDVPQLQLLGNRDMSSWISASGGSALFLGKVALTRWSSYPIADAYGQRLYVRLDDAEDAQLLAEAPFSESGSTGNSDVSVENTRTLFAQHMVEQQRRFDNIIVRQNTTVSPADNVEIRAICVINEGNQTRRITLTSYAEVSLSTPEEYERHPAFSKLFVFSEYLARQRGLLFVRRSRDDNDSPPVLLHQVVFDDPDIDLIGYETDRMAFLGRQGTSKQPMALEHGLDGCTGWTQDAVMALQVQVTLTPGEEKNLAYLTFAAYAKAEVLDMARRYPSPQLDWVLQDSNLQASHEISQLEIDPARLPELQSLVSAMLHPVNALRVHHGESAVGSASQTILWQFGISGDMPILVLTMAGEETSGALELLIRAQHLWRQKGLEFDLVVLRKDSSGYEEPLREQILSVLRDFNVFGYLGRRGGIHLLSADHIDPLVRRTLEALATVVLKDNSVTLGQQLEQLWQAKILPPLFNPIPGQGYSSIDELTRPTQLEFDNGFGGFCPHSSDYVIHVEPGKPTPAPWCNVIANEMFGTVVSESGLGFSWLINSGEFRLTPWANDPVADPAAEILYLRDEMNADIWSVTPAPLSHDHVVGITHGPGYTQWQQHSHGLQQTLTASVALHDPVKLMHLQLHNPSASARRITATYYVDWCLGALVSQSRAHVRSSYDAERHTVFAYNEWNYEFAECIGFVTATAPPHSITGDRCEFLGPSRDTSQPQSLKRWDLGGRFPADADPCAAYQIHIDIAPGATEEVVFILGAASTRSAAQDIVARWQNPTTCNDGLNAVHAMWRSHLDTLQVRTPDRAFDLMVNRWLPYQALSCRINARAGYYQAGGAYGFRDQLQDVLCLIGRDPGRVRSQIIESAKHQFEQGDVLHWWHPPAGRGVRTRCSDDFLWLVYVVARYIHATGDNAILETEIPFLQAAPLRDDEHDRYTLFETGEVSSLYTHCCRALQYMQRLGEHGLPLIGDGDWNDGMNRVGDRGRGESVWLAWFQITTVELFHGIALDKGDADLVGHWQRYTNELKQAVENNAWDGQWYVRAFDDDGITWGSSTNDECQIDSLAQSWAVLSGAADKRRARTAMDSATAHLVDTEHRLVRLLAPPFDKTSRDPGYIKAYPPGVRENGGQYTHAATWFGLAAAALGEGDTALQVFDIICPTRSALNRQAAQHYAREPYVLAGDVSGSVSDPGRGGWSWYTGAAGWTWQLAVHGILGIAYVPGGITINPCLPTFWDFADCTVTQGLASIALHIENPDGVGRGLLDITVDGEPFHDAVIAYPQSNNEKRVIVRIRVD